MTLALVTSHDATLPKPAPIPVPGGFGWPDDQLPPGLTSEDVTRISETIAAGRAESTHRSYASSWRRFERWCTQRGIDGLPATSATVCAYLTDYAGQGVAAGTIECSCAAIADAHHREGQPNPVADETVRAVRRGIRRTLGTAPRRQSRPLNTDDIRQMLGGIDRTTVKGIRAAAVILLGFASALRRSELAGLDLDDIEQKSDGLLVHVRKSKGDLEQRGQIVGVAYGTSVTTDPIAALDTWLDLRGSEPGRLFSGVSNQRVTTRPFTGSGLARMLKDRAAAVGIPSERVSGHSLRAGHATPPLWPVSTLPASPPKPGTPASQRSSSTTSAPLRRSR